MPINCIIKIERSCPNKTFNEGILVYISVIINHFDEFFIGSGETKADTVAYRCVIPGANSIG